MKHKKSYNAIIGIVLVILLSSLACYGIWCWPEVSAISKPLHMACVIVVTAVIVINLIKLDYRHKYTDRMTGINNDAWVIRKGAILYFRKKLNGYDSVFVNIKDCKYINQKVTNSNGDVVISDFAKRLKLFLHKKGYIGRMGGDNFLVFIKDEYLDEFLDFVNNQVVEIEHNGKLEILNVSARAGIYKIQNLDSRQQDSNGYRNVINRAALALSKAKEAYLDYFTFEADMMENLMKDTEILKEVRKAMNNHEFMPYYQSKVDARTGRMCGAEGLVRWNHDGKLICPGDFIPLLERSGEITDLDYLVFELVCADIKNWIDAGIEPVKVSTNFSKLHLGEIDFAEKIISIKNRYGVDGKYIEVELTESTEEKNLFALREFSKKMKKENISIAIDDFGTGYSSLSLIRNFDADVIKLDKSFIDSATKDNPVSRNFVRDIIHMIENLGEQTLCEGVEDKEQLDFLVEAGCNIIQGYYFDKPMPKEAFEEKLRSPMYDL